MKKILLILLFVLAANSIFGQYKSPSQSELTTKLLKIGVNVGGTEVLLYSSEFSPDKVNPSDSPKTDTYTRFIILPKGKKFSFRVGLSDLDKYYWIGMAIDRKSIFPFCAFIHQPENLISWTKVNNNLAGATIMNTGKTFSGFLNEHGEIAEPFVGSYQDGRFYVLEIAVFRPGEEYSESSSSKDRMNYKPRKTAYEVIKLVFAEEKTLRDTGNLL